MKLRTVIKLLIVTTSISACGLLGIHKDNVNADPDYQAERLKEIYTRPAAVRWDSLIRKIDSAPTMFPSDLKETTLIIETYKYKDYLRTFENRLFIPKDNKQERRQFKRYEKKKHLLIKNPKYKIVYLDKGEYDNLDLKNYKYVLRTSTKLEYDSNHLVVNNDGFVYPFISTSFFYIYNRETKEVYKAIKDTKDLSILSKK